MLCQLAEQFARASVPEEIVDAFRMGRMTALQKPSCGVRGTVVGDTFRRLVARTVAQQLRTAEEEATAPFQCALSTRSGGECVAACGPLCSRLLGVEGSGRGPHWLQLMRR